MENTRVCSFIRVYLYKQKKKQIFQTKRKKKKKKIKCIYIDLIFDLDHNHHSFVANLVRFDQRQNQLNRRKRVRKFLIFEENLPAFLCK